VIRKKMNPGKAIVFGVLLALAVIAFTGIASASTIYVPDDYSTIQAAVNAASSGDTIIVRDGTYTENVKVDKKRLTIRSENGFDSTIVQAEDPDDHVFNVTADYVKISGFTVEGATGYEDAGIYIYYADYCNISNNNCSNNDDGIHLEYSNNNSISNNNCSNNDGIYLEYSNDNSISNNICSNNDDDGIYLEYSNNNSISNNICSNNRYGIHPWRSSNNKLTGNILLENGIGIWGRSLSHYTHEIDTSNTVNGKPVYYWKDVEGGRIPAGAGQVILVNCKNIVVENQELNKASIGIEVAFSSCITIKNNNCSNNNWAGILLDRYSNNNSISNNIASILLDRYSNNNNISNNNCSNNGGINLYYSNNNSISDNNCSNNGGIYLYYSNNNSISDNNCSNDWAGILVESSNNNSISSNNCSNNEYGICLLWDSNNNSISNNNCSNNYDGIYLDYSKNNSISSNNCSNNGAGIGLLWDSNNNLIYLNNFINNTYNVNSSDSTNTWNSPEKITYAYDETTYTSCLGNYYDDYTGTDRNRDGIGDTPYQIDGDDSDMYPLIERWENYFAYPEPPLEIAPSERQSKIIYFILRWILED
jgi:parallel beta-helix repeat protein